jgi:hypothetical protein
MTVRTDSYILFGIILVIQGVFPLELFVTGQQSLRAFLDWGHRFSHAPIFGRDVSFQLSAEVR